MDTLRNPNHVGHIGAHRKQQATAVEIAKIHAEYHVRRIGKYITHTMLFLAINSVPLFFWETLNLRTYAELMIHVL